MDIFVYVCCEFCKLMTVRRIPKRLPPLIKSGSEKHIFSLAPTGKYQVLPDFFYRNCLKESNISYDLNVCGLTLCIFFLQCAHHADSGLWFFHVLG